ncbi:MAG: hypothetical protein LUM44_12515 [Pyrinomonadaceae bacterium]|nr:hypothetical protein [Pyrinomonadaceae bacterium]
MRNTSKIKLFITANLLAIGFVTVFLSESAAQTTRKNKKGTVKAQPFPTPAETIPEIISRADDYPNENQVVQIPQDQTQTNEAANDGLDKTNARVKELNARMKNLESAKKDPYEEKQKRLLLNLDILTRAEQRAETIRKQMFEMIEKESAIKNRLDNIENDIRPEVIERQVAFAGSLRPEQLREMRKKNLESEKANLQNLLTEIQNTRANLEANVQKADQLVEKLRLKLEKDIDDALADEANQ